LKELHLLTWFGYVMMDYALHEEEAGGENGYDISED
jgi:hypothetical protein